jgi:hypothetical protein
MALLHASNACSAYIPLVIIQSWVRVEICPTFNTFSISSTDSLSPRNPVYKMPVGIRLAQQKYTNTCCK